MKVICIHNSAPAIEFLKGYPLIIPPPPSQYEVVLPGEICTVVRILFANEQRYYIFRERNQPHRELHFNAKNFILLTGLGEEEPERYDYFDDLPPELEEDFAEEENDDDPEDRSLSHC